MDIVARTVSLSDTVTLRVEVAGDGEPLVLLPGLGCSSRCFHPLMRSLAERSISVIAINPRGIGGSTGPLHDLTKHDLATDAMGVIETLNLGPVHAVGWAWGGGDARCLASDAPDRVKTVVLLSAAGSATVEPEALAALSRLAKNVYATPEDRMRDVSLAFLASASDRALGEWLDFGFWPEGMAAFEACNRQSFMAHWRRILVDESIVQRTIIVDGQVAGGVVSFASPSPPTSS
jgi:pimeloyl-ACP methyl ester carboxylesterase